MKLTKQQIEALSDLYEVMKKHSLGFFPQGKWGNEILKIRMMPSFELEINYLTKHDVKNLLNENKGVSDDA